MHQSLVLSRTLLPVGLTLHLDSRLGESLRFFEIENTRGSSYGTSRDRWNYWYSNAVSIPVEITAATILITFWDANVRDNSLWPIDTLINAYTHR